jgi:hypothetical protein
MGGVHKVSINPIIQSKTRLTVRTPTRDNIKLSIQSRTLHFFFFLFFFYYDGFGSVACSHSELILKFWTLQTTGRTPRTGNQPVARPLPTQDKRRHTSMPRMGLEPMIAVFKRLKIFCILDRSATVTLRFSMCRILAASRFRQEPETKAFVKYSLTLKFVIMLHYLLTLPLITSLFVCHSVVVKYT